MAKKLGTKEEVVEGAVKIGGGRAAARQLPSLTPNSPFYLVANPRCWMVCPEAKNLVPMLRSVVLAPGVNHCKHGVDEVDTSLLLARSGTDVILTDTAKYLKRINCVKGPAYITMFEKATPGSTTTIRDDKAYAAFLASVAKDLPAPPRDVITAGLEKAEALAERFYGSERPKAKRRLKRLEAEVAVWEKALEANTKAAE